MILKVLGTGCPKCKKLYEECQKAIASSGGSDELVKVETIDDILAYGVMMTPALVINEKVVMSGRVASATEIAGWMSAAGA